MRSRNQRPQRWPLPACAKLAKVNSAPWMLATSEDFRVRGVTGGTPDRITRFIQRYVDRVVALSTESVVVRDSLLRVFNLLEGPQKLFHPQIVLRIVRRVLNQSIRRMAAPSILWAQTNSDARRAIEPRHSRRTSRLRSS
jgi:hypothetical protein